MCPKSWLSSKVFDQRRTVAHRQFLLAHWTDLVNGACHQLFAGTGGPDEQDIGVMTRHLARKVKNFQHRRTFAHNAVEFQILEQLLFELTHPPPLVVQSRDVVECAFQTHAVNGLGQKIR